MPAQIGMLMCIHIENPHELDKETTAKLAEFICAISTHSDFVGTRAAQELNGEFSADDSSSGETKEATSTSLIDSTGLPWDSRIHSSSKELNSNGEWKKRRGVSPQVLDAVTKELREAMAAPGPGETLEAPPKFELPNFDANLPDAPAGLVPPAATLPDAPVFDPATLGQATPVAITYDQATSIIGEAITRKQFTNADVFGKLGELGLPNFMALQHRLDLIPSLLAKLGIQA